ncbi:hypothetical protein [Tuwongella immobilis]|uniref:Uncharacterized protein n=1 Tax=Tuwongella immobilis TaxID=692036 RepID=A0A6C2YNM2_9BACT|nr:hypothetical protein [Tuwongella immobilis]VIP02723.1 Uncharacterized protein OS=Planctomyces maris DSM 8797 GN=PM8797T_28814 PE=4 SV=1 [Tuwongella immobilis]VTS02260.1 Uncharacterized protein OS=Planctomyces maris DSM 8797 GN=PM8797T_28814 PE=4 SV=1 [Tuwongella immobilis]
MRKLRRYCLVTLLGLGSLSASGCMSWFKRSLPPLPDTNIQDDGQVPTAEGLVNYLNRNASYLSTIDCKDMDIEASAQGRSAPTVSATMICQKPRNFRLNGRVMGIPQLDFGSNPNEFWFWVKEGPPYLFHCSYADFEKGGVQLPFPFQPEWVVQALGMATYGDPANYRVELKPKTIELIEDAVMPSGEKVRKTTVFNRVNVAPPYPQVQEYVMQNARGDVICSAKIKEVRVAYIPDTQEPVIYPRVVELNWPPEQIKMELTLNKVQINPSLPPQQTAKLFTRPVRRDVPLYDLARRPQPSGVPASRAGQVQATAGYDRR